jgi:hypothetical protein
VSDGLLAHVLPHKTVSASCYLQNDDAGEACACKPEELQNLKHACQVQAGELQQHIDTLKVRTTVTCGLYASV